MYRVLKHLPFLLLVLSVTSRLNADLVGHWKLDEGSGTTVADSSGNGNDGTIVSGPTWIPGVDGRALEFHATGVTAGSGGHVDCGSGASLDITGPISIALWIRPDADDPEGNLTTTAPMCKAMQGMSPSWSFQVRYGWGQGAPTPYMSFTFNTSPRAWAHVGRNLLRHEWVHIACSYDGTTLRCYLDGEEANSTPMGPITSSPAPVLIGSDGWGWDWNGGIDDVRMYNHALTAEEIQQAMRPTPPGAASKPSPADQATDIPRDVVLSWTPGEYAPPVNGHRVYLGESFNDVNDGVGGIAQDANSYDPGRLDFETTYYWRVDEVNAPPDSTVHKGSVWSFATEPVGYPIDGASITATASSTGQADFGPEKTIDGSGLDDSSLHSTSATDMWLSGDEPQGAWIQYEFDKVQKLHQMWVWNSNQIFEALFGFGMKDVTVEYSANGADWTAVAEVPQFAKAPGTVGYAHDTTVDFGGAVAKYVRLTATSNWGGLVAQYGLSEVRFFAIPVSAREPSPESGTADVDPDVTLSWRAGRETAVHNVYVSSDQQAVIDGTVPAVSVTDASYSSALDLGSTYYWRVDEVNEAETPAMWQGDLWDFTTQQFIVVEEFEDYNDWPPYEIYTTWVDGYENPANGSQVGYLTPPSVETTIVHGGSQSMPLLYSNTGGATYSEAERTFTPGQDWTKYGIQTLGLWFHGTGGNTGQLYVKINGAKVPYDGDATNLAAAGWQPWNIDLTMLGVNLQSVSSLGIGIDGNGAVGTLYIDDIRLYAYARQLVTPVEPVPANLAAHWPLDGTFNDSSGNGRHGTPMGGPIFAPGKMGQAVSLDGTDDYVTIAGYKGINADRTDPNNPIQRPFSVTCWINTTGNGSLVCWGSSDGTGVGGQYQNFRIDGGRLRAEHGNGRFRGAADVNDGQWHHVAMTVAEGADLWPPGTQLYVDGLKDTEGADTVNAQNIWNLTEDADVGIGTRASHVDRFFTGTIDDARIYERVLTEEEIAWLAGRTLPYDAPF